MKPNVIVALIVGAVLGFAVGKAVTSSGGGGGNPGGSAQVRPTPMPGAQGEAATVFKVPVGDSPVKGPNDALVTIVEFSDYQCPFCSRAEGTMKELGSQYGDKVRFVMKQNPLPFHPRAKPAALAALAAGKQGKYWQMHSEMFENQKSIEDADLEGYARDIGLNVEKWKADMQSPELAAIIQKDQAQAQSLGATGTPAFFINGRKVVGAQPKDSFTSIIDEELGKAEALVKAGTPKSQVYEKLTEKGQTAPPPAPAPDQGAAPVAAVKNIDVPADSPVMGPKTAKVTIVEWSDFQCPFCSRAVPTLKQIEETYKNDVRVVFRHQPLPFHNNARVAAEASMAANEQGKFWPMHDKMFANQQALDRGSLDGYAQELGLDMGKFKAAMDGHKFAAQIDRDSQTGSRVGADGTPTFFINGRELVGAQPFESFKAMIDEEIKKADKLLASGVKPDQLYEKLMADAAKAPAPQPQAAPQQAPVQNIEVGNAPAKGDKNAPITIIAYSDFQCPFCSRAVPTLKQIEDTYGKKVRIAFKNQPLPFHNNARPAAAAALAAAEQGKFWEYHDKLFANQQALDRPSLERYAQELGLNMQKFKSALDSNKFEQQIAADQAEAGRVGANGTPTFFINGRQLVGAQPFEQFKAIIDDELSKKGK